MFSSLVNRGALLAVVSLLSSSVAAEVFEKLSTVPQGLCPVSLPKRRD
jgi:tripeptidyl-peptidase-1